jgi:hypothetical protein
MCYRYASKPLNHKLNAPFHLGFYLHHVKTLAPLMMNIFIYALDGESKGSAKRPYKGHNLTFQQIEAFNTLDNL